MNYYNEHDKKSCAWLRILIEAGLIPPGEVDERDIQDVKSTELAGFTQCHFFAGIAGWSLALRLAGYPDTRRIWTASCPCQPISCAGKQRGEKDERHLWPELYRLISECRPECIIGEQTSGPDGVEWFDGISADMEEFLYRVAACDLPSPCVGAPNIRQRLYWVAHSEHTDRPPLGVHRENGCDGENCGREKTHGESGTCSEVHGLAIPECDANDSRGIANERGEGDGAQGGGAHDESGRCGDAGRLDNATGNGARCGTTTEPSSDGKDDGISREASQVGHRMADTNSQGPQRRTIQELRERTGQCAAGESGSLGFWDDSVWHQCRDGKSRRIPAQSILQRVASGLPEGLDLLRAASHGFPVASKIPGRIALLRGYGNAINPRLAAEFIKVVMEIL